MKFLEVTNPSTRSKLFIDIDDISKVESVSDKHLFAPRNALGAICLKDRSVQFTTEPYYEIRKVLADLCEIKAVEGD